MKDAQEKKYQAPSLTVYGDAEKITANQNSKATDNLEGDPGDTTFYSVGK